MKREPLDKSMQDKLVLRVSDRASAVCVQFASPRPPPRRQGQGTPPVSCTQFPERYPIQMDTASI